MSMISQARALLTPPYWLIFLLLRMLVRVIMLMLMRTTQQDLQRLTAARKPGRLLDLTLRRMVKYFNSLALRLKSDRPAVVI